MIGHIFLLTLFGGSPTNSTLNFVFFIHDNVQSHKKWLNTCKQQWRNSYEASSPCRTPPACDNELSYAKHLLRRLKKIYEKCTSTACLGNSKKPNRPKPKRSDDNIEYVKRTIYENTTTSSRHKFRS